MKYLKRFFNWLFSFWLLDKAENKIEEIPQKGFKKSMNDLINDLPPETKKREIKNSPKMFGEYFLNHKIPKHIKKQKQK